MNFLRKLIGKKEPNLLVLTDETKKMMYFTDEFRSIGDMTESGTLSFHEFTRLMGLLRYKKDTTTLWESQGKQKGIGHMTQGEYIAMMAKGNVEIESSTWRKMFNDFDTDSTGYVSYEELTKGLAKMGISDISAAKVMAVKIDASKDGKLCYVEFLKYQLKIQ